AVVSTLAMGGVGLLIALAQPQTLAPLVVALSYAGFLVGSLAGLVSGAALALATARSGVPRRPRGEVVFAIVFALVQAGVCLLLGVPASTRPGVAAAAIPLAAGLGGVSGAWLAVRLRRFASPARRAAETPPGG
ncbi:MAG: hypothetical protein KDA41_00570, partial [Planctomycetales bacterium]|nr:hypothetical protein [Planctomycetales bacterium]